MWRGAFDGVPTAQSGKSPVPSSASDVNEPVTFLQHAGAGALNGAGIGVCNDARKRISRQASLEMTGRDQAPLWLQLAALAVVLAPTIVVVAMRRRIGRMNAASGLVVYGAVAAGAEHGHWAMRLAIHERAWAEPHATVHYFMAGTYAAIAGVLLSVIALTLFREGRRAGWFTVLFVLVVGGTLELTMNGPTGYLYHHIGLYGYVAAWIAALVLAHGPTFSPQRSVIAPNVRRRPSGV